MLKCQDSSFLNMKNRPFLYNSFSVIVPFYNEEEVIGHMLKSWKNQQRLPEEMILINNGSTDRSLEIVQEFIQDNSNSIQIILLHEERPGKIFALEKAQPYISGEYAVFCDADTWYPPHYLKTVEEQLEKSPAKVVAVMALNLPDAPESVESKRAIRGKLMAWHLFPDKCHTGGYGQVFKTSVLRKCGGFHSSRWSYVLMDHEIVHRLHKFGCSLYHRDLWVITSNRRSNRNRVRWTVWESFLYFVLPHWAGDWFWYGLLGPRFARRNLNHLNLREQPWKKPQISAA